jgi:hypothetical protein
MKIEKSYKKTSTVGGSGGLDAELKKQGKCLKVHASE